MKKLSYICLLLVVGSTAFFAGVTWHKNSLLNCQTFVLEKQLDVQVDPKNIGNLPAGTILYKYNSSNQDIDTFIVFVNMKNLNILKPTKFEKSFTVAPISGYVEQ